MKLFCTFCDFQKAFDSVWRIGLWTKLLKSETDEKLLRIFYNIYMGIKSCVSLNGQHSDLFVSETELRQGKILSPVLFSHFLNVLEEFMIAHRCNGIVIECTDDDFTFQPSFYYCCTQMTLLSYENEVSLKYNSDQFLKFCKDWKLCINYAKTKILSFGARNIERFHFHLDNNILETVDSFKYLGVIFSNSRSFLKTRLKLQINLFDHN